MKVQLQYEIQDNKGSARASFWKEIDMPSAPTKELVFDDDDFTFEPNRSIIYSTESQTYFVRTVQYTEDNFEDTKAMFIKLGWKMS